MLVMFQDIIEKECLLGAHVEIGIDFPPQGAPDVSLIGNREGLLSIAKFLLFLAEAPLQTYFSLTKENQFIQSCEVDLLFRHGLLWQSLKKKLSSASPPWLLSDEKELEVFRKYEEVKRMQILREVWEEDQQIRADLSQLPGGSFVVFSANKPGLISFAKLLGFVAQDEFQDGYSIHFDKWNGMHSESNVGLIIIKSKWGAAALD